MFTLNEFLVLGHVQVGILEFGTKTKRPIGAIVLDDQHGLDFDGSLAQEIAHADLFQIVRVVAARLDFFPLANKQSHNSRQQSNNASRPDGGKFSV